MRKKICLLSVVLGFIFTIYSCEKTNDSETLTPQADTIFSPFPDTVGSQFIIYTIGSTSRAILRPQDTLDAGFSSSLNETTISSYSNAISGIGATGGVYMVIAGTRSAGIKTLATVRVREQPNLLLVKQGDLKVNISQFDNFKNGYVIGSFSGTLKDSFSITTYPFKCSFKVQLD